MEYAFGISGVLECLFVLEEETSVNYLVSIFYCGGIRFLKIVSVEYVYCLLLSLVDATERINPRSLKHGLVSPGCTHLHVFLDA